MRGIISLPDNHVYHGFGLRGVVRDEQHAAATLEIVAVSVYRDFDFLALARHDFLLADAHAQSRIIYLQGTDNERRLAIVAQGELPRHALLLAKRRQRDVRRV